MRWRVGPLCGLPTSASQQRAYGAAAERGCRCVEKQGVANKATRFKRPGYRRRSASPVRERVTGAERVTRQIETSNWGKETKDKK